MSNRSAKDEAQSNHTDADLMTAAALAELLQVNRDTIYRETASGRIPHFKIGSRYRYSRKRIEQWIQQEVAQQQISHSLA